MAQWIGEIGSSKGDDLVQFGDWGEALRKEKREERMKASEARSTLALEEFKRQNQTREYIMKAYQNYWNKDAQQRALFDQSDAGREFIKFVRKNTPELIGDDGRLIPMPSEPLKSNTGYKPQTREEALQFQTALEEGKQLIKSNAPLSQQDAIRLIQTGSALIQNGYEKEGQEFVEFGKSKLQGMSSPQQSVRTPNVVGTLGDAPAQQTSGLMGMGSNLLTSALSKFGTKTQPIDDAASFIAKYK